MSAAANFTCRSGSARRLRGRTGIVISGRQALLDRLGSVRKKLEGTQFNFTEHNDYVQAVCPWGNQIRCHEPDAARFGRITLGIPYVEFDVPAGSAKGIAAFYAQMIETPAEVVERRRHGRAHHGRTRISIFCTSARPTGRCRSSTSITSRSTWRIFPARTIG